MFAALVDEGEVVLLPSGRRGVVAGRGEDHHAVVRLDGDPENTVEIYAKHLRRVSCRENWRQERDFGD